MKYLVIFLLLLSLTANAQKIHFTDAGNYWIYSYSQGGPSCESKYYSFILDNDTVVSGERYKQMLHASVISGSYPTCQGTYYSKSWLREDTASGIVYYSSSPGVSETVLYNYNLNIGDVIDFGFARDSVVDTGSTIINGVRHKTMTLTAPGFRNYCVVEGIGTTHSPIFPLNTDGTCRSSRTTLCSFSQNDTYPAFSAPYFPFCKLYFEYTFNNSSACTPIKLSVANTPALAKELLVHPNPATSGITVSFPGKIHSLAITDLVGQTIYSNEYDSENIQVAIDDIPAGIYLVRVNNTYVQKLVKQ